MSEIIQNVLIKKAWQELEVQVRTGGFLALEFELDRCTYQLLGHVREADEKFIREGVKYIKGVGARIDESTFLEV